MKRLKKMWGALMLFLSSVSKAVLCLITLVALPVLLIAFCALLVEGDTELLLPIAVMSGVMGYISTKL